VRYEPGADTETSWTFLDPSAGRLNPSQIRFDQAGHLWISQLSGSSIDEFDPSTNSFVSFGGFTSPIHFELFQGRIYVAEAPNGNGVVAVLDPKLALSRSAGGTAAGVVLTPLTVPVRHIVNAKPALIRDSTITPTTFVSKTNGFTTSDLTVTAGAAGTGILFTSFANRNAYGISHVGWGLHERGLWHALSLYGSTAMGLDGQVFEGNFLFSTGPNHAAGRQSRCHFDIPMRHCSIFLDGTPIVIDGAIVEPSIRRAGM